MDLSGTHSHLDYLGTLFLTKKGRMRPGLASGTPDRTALAAYRPAQGLAEDRWLAHNPDAPCQQVVRGQQIASLKFLANVKNSDAITFQKPTFPPSLRRKIELEHSTSLHLSTARLIWC